MNLRNVLAGSAAIFGLATAGAAENAVTQDLVSVRASGQVAASWSRQQDYYVLAVAVERSKPRPKSVTADRPQPPPAAAAIPAQPAVVGGAIGPSGRQDDRGSYFLGNTIANLRGLDPWFACGRTLTLIDGRRVVSKSDGRGAAVQQVEPPRPAPPSPINQPYPPKLKEGRVEVWLLRKDGTQILPAVYSCAGGETQAARETPIEISYAFSAADSEQAVAAAIRIDDEFYIEKLQTLATAKALQ